MRIIAERPGWALYDRQRSSNGWRSLKLVAFERRHKGSWYFGFNGERLSRSTDADLLAEHEPEIYQWVLDELRRLNPQRLVEPRSQPKLRGMRD
jgi:hypothetical protein